MAGQPRHDVADAPSFVPRWSADAIWYQVFVSRFCNGDWANDPPGTLPWTADWAKLEAGERPPLRDRLLERSYGGDSQGLRAKLTYLQDLGVNTLYLNPIFQAPSQHKYDTEDYRHVDDSYGIADSRLQLRGETLDPATWRWSQSDRLFLDFLADAHCRGFRVVLDGVFNHVGPQFAPWRDVQEAGLASPYAEWFDVTEWGPPIQWRAWDGPNGYLVNFRRFGDGLHPDVEAYLFAVVRRWMDPDANGDPSDGIDGWRLDAPERLPHGSWRRFRDVAKAVNPDALILGEIWADPTRWLQGEQFDAVTNYRFSAVATRFFGQEHACREPTTFVEEIDRLRRSQSPDVALAMMNVLGTHDTDRTVTMLTDPLRHVAGPIESVSQIPRRDVLEPDEDAFRRLKLLAFFQFTCPGAPLLYYGDEVGMYGGDDPFCRAPMWWLGTSAPGYRTDILEFHRRLVRLRRDRPELRRGRFRLVLADDARRVVAFSRRYAGRESVVVINGDADRQDVVLALGQPGRRVSWALFNTAADDPGEVLARSAQIGPDGRLIAVCPPLSGLVIAVQANSGLSRRGKAD